MDPTTLPILWILLIVFLAALVRSVFGFGDALVGMPLLALAVPMTLATPLMSLVGPAIGLLLIVREGRRISLRGTGGLIIGTLAGIPAGLLVLKRADNRTVCLILAGLIIPFALYSLFRPGIARLRTDRSAPVFGIAAGILGAAVNTNGPPVAFYGALRGWEPETFRTSLQAYFLPTGAAIIAAQGAAGLWTAAVWRIFLFSVPLIFLASWAGGRLAKRIPAASFVRWIYGILVAAGLVLLVRNLI